ncbi:multiple epidermal growth factor-like domains protein 10 [Mya arenaria]|uniref:multiple epidermal growth factor-like domains protein 10 n=1 Tax=Mya arenaria TaxID=6604 RepID=UPI0022E2CEAC|nr:multiple epidermal growth factor-like domains protein 10 [Mya arenaria]
MHLIPGVGQSSNLTVYANNISITGGAIFSDWTNLGDIMSSDNVNGVLLDLQSPRAFRYLTITNNGTTVMTICEVKLYAKDCDVGKFGDRCVNHCHCKDGRLCDSVTGECSTIGCSAGWKELACNISCAHQRFGQNCSSSCHCGNNTDCDKSSGLCPALGVCENGWKNDQCDIACGHQLFGQNCSSSCHCFNDTDCEKENGLCPARGVCENGWKTERCNAVEDIYTSYLVLSR